MRTEGTRRRQRPRLAAGAGLAGLLAGLMAAAAHAHDYPTEVIADYVFGCMATNGQTPEALRQCSCSIDVVASILPFEEYQQAEVTLRMRQVKGGGEKMALFRETAMAKDAVARLRRAQVEAETRCFK